MKLLAVADIHSNLYYTELLAVAADGADAVIVAGDITSYGTISDAVEYLRLLSRVAPVYFVIGESDHPRLLDTSWDENGIYNLHYRRVTLPFQLEAVGVGGALYSSTARGVLVRDSEIELFLEEVESTPSIVVSHVPPARTCADARSGLGSLSLTMFIERRSPLLAIAGHVHHGRCVEVYGRTTIVNPGPLRRGYYSIIYVEDGRVEVDLARLEASRLS